MGTEQFYRCFANVIITYYLYLLPIKNFRRLKLWTKNKNIVHMLLISKLICPKYLNVEFVGFSRKDFSIQNKRSNE